MSLCEGSRKLASWREHPQFSFDIPYCSWCGRSDMMAKGGYLPSHSAIPWKSRRDYVAEGKRRQRDRSKK